MDDMFDVFFNSILNLLCHYFPRCLVVYPWCLRYFGNFGNLYSAKDIMANPMIAAHGIKIVHGLDRAMQNMDNIKDTYTELSTLHSEKLHVDPDNFRVTIINNNYSCISLFPPKQRYTFFIRLYLLKMSIQHFLSRFG